MAVNYKAPVKDIVFGYQVINSYDVLSKISQFSDFSEDIVIPTMEECGKFAEEVLAPINAVGDGCNCVTFNSGHRLGFLVVSPDFRNLGFSFPFTYWV